MIVYAVMLTHIPTGKNIFKVGHTQKKIMERFSGEEYNIFNIVRVDHIYFSRDDWQEAKHLAVKIEHEALRPFKKPSTFIIEDYLGIESNALNDSNGKPLSGITEMFVLETNEEVQKFLQHFRNVKSLYHEGN
jgi:hypothetical protein